MIKKQYTLLFISLAIAFIVSTTSEPFAMSWGLKISPILLLIFVFSNNLESKTSRLFLCGLIFSMFGDIFLDVNREELFIWGLGAFFIAHIFYIFSLLPFKRKSLKAVSIYALYGIAMCAVLASSLGDLLVPVIVYMAILLFMAISTIISTNSNQWLILGGLSFVISDSLIGINKFIVDIPSSAVFIMFFYYAAQYCLVTGMIKSTIKKGNE